MTTLLARGFQGVNQGIKHSWRNTTRAQNKPGTRSTNQTFDNLINYLLVLVSADNKDKAQKLSKEIQESYQRGTKRTVTPTENNQDDPRKAYLCVLSV